MTDETPNDGRPQYLIVHTAKQLPTYLPWVTYALIIGNTWIADDGNNWYLYSVAAVGLGMTYCFYNTYHALVALYNEVRVDAAVRRVKPEVPMASDSEQQATKSADTAVLKRYWDALTWINSNSACLTIGDARDAAWRVLDYDQIQASIKEEVDRGDDKEASN